MKKNITAITACQFLSLLLAFCLAAATNAGPVLRNLDHAILSQESEKVTLQLNGSYSPTIFTLNGGTPRIVLDFPGMIQARAVANRTQTNGTIVTRIRVGMHTGDAPKTRVVFDVATLDGLTYTPQLDDETNVLTVLLTASTVAVDTKNGKPTAVPQQALLVNEKPPVKEAAQPPAAPEQVPAPTPSVPDSSQHAAFEPFPAPTDRPAESPGISATVSETTQPRLAAITFDKAAAKGEMVMFKLNGFYPPRVQGVEEGIPRVICDFDAVELADTVENIIKADGKYVQNIRVGKHTNPDRVRVVLDLAPNHSYDLQQVFFKEDNLFVMIVNTLQEERPLTAPAR
jgi:hypothetical protein